MERDETIAGYLRNWKAIQQNRPNQGKSVTKKHRKRPQSGLFHVYIRGTNHKIIFYDNQDRSVFLIILNGEAVKNKSQISAFILMDNHLHLQIKTENLSSLIKCVLSRYAIWFNNRRGWKGPLFEKPFGSSPIHSSMLIKTTFCIFSAMPFGRESAFTLKIIYGRHIILVLIQLLVKFVN